MTQPSPSPAPRFKSERLSFDTGDWWDIRSVLSVGLDREFSDIALKTQLLLKPDVGNPEMVADLAQRMDALVLKCTTGWSYGEINEATLHNEVPAPHYQIAGDRMVKLYAPLLLKNIEMLLSASSLPSSQEADGRSPTSSATPTSPT